MMTTVQHDLDAPREHAVLLRQYARVQDRCSQLLSRQKDEIEALKTAAVRLRGALIVRETQLAWLREDQQASDALAPTLQKRTAMSRRIDELLARVHSLMRERLHWQWNVALSKSAPTPAAIPTAVPTAIPAAIPAALPAALPTPMPAPVERERPPMATSLQHTAVEWEGPEAVLRFEASVAAADLVICQAGCLSHGDYWRVQDHCRRTGKTCVLVEQPDVRIVTVQRAPV